MANNWSYTWRASGTNMENAAVRTFAVQLPPLADNYRRITSIVRRNGVYCKTGGTSQNVIMQGYDELLVNGEVLLQSSTGACKAYGSGPSSANYMVTEFADISAQDSRRILDAWASGTLQIRRTVWIYSASSGSHGQPYFRSGYYNDDIMLTGTDSAYMPVVEITAFSAADTDRLYANTWTSPPFDFTVRTTIANSDYWEDPAKLYRRMTISAVNMTGESEAMDTITLENSGTDSTVWTVTQNDVAFTRKTDGFLRGARYRITFALAVGADASAVTETATAFAEIDVAAIPFHMSRHGNGVSVGKYSSVGSDESEKLFECAYPARFYENVEGIADYSTAAMPIAGTWLDGRRVHRVVIPFEAAAGANEIAVISDMDVLVSLGGSVEWPSGFKLPISHYLAGDNYHQAFFQDSALIFITATAAAGHVIVDYVKTAKEAI